MQKLIKRLKEKNRTKLLSVFSEETIDVLIVINVDHFTRQRKYSSWIMVIAVCGNDKKVMY